MRVFADNSIWNIPAREKGRVTSTQLPASVHSYANKLEVTKDFKWSKPIFYAKDSDPRYTWVDTNGWVSGNIKYQGEPIPLPQGAHEATGSDGHLCIVTADKRYAYDFWRANVGTKRAEAICKWDLRGSGVPDRLTTSARGAGVPLLTTVVRADDSFHHAGGLTVPNVESHFVNPPATHSDGRATNGLQYGQLYVLRSDFPVYGNDFLRSLIKQLRSYGAYLVDQGASLGIDCQPQAVDLLPDQLNITAKDFRLVKVA